MAGERIVFDLPEAEGDEKQKSELDQARELHRQR